MPAPLRLLASSAPQVVVSQTCPLSPLCAQRMVRLPAVPAFSSPARLRPLLRVLVVPSASVTVTEPALSSAISNAQLLLSLDTSILTPARVMFAETPEATAIRSFVVVPLMVIAFADRMVRTLFSYV